MKVGYCVPHAPHMASYRLRVALPARHLDCDYEIGCTGDCHPAAHPDILETSSERNVGIAELRTAVFAAALA